MKIVTPEVFLQENTSAGSKEIVDFIVHQFDDKRQNGVTQAQLNSLWDDINLRNEHSLMRFQIVDQKLYADAVELNSLYFKPYFKYLSNFLKKYKVNDIDFIIYGRDEIRTKGFAEETLGIPAFMMSKNINSPYEKEKLLLPDSFIFQSWESLISRIEKASHTYPWESKENKVFWRGGAHGARQEHYYNISNFDKLPRLSIAILSKLYPDLIDAELIGHGEFSGDKDGDNLRFILELLSKKTHSRVNEEDHLKYKYLIAIDGNTSPWLRMPWIMLSNSVLLKQETGIIEWFYPALKANVHYTPITKDLSNIFSQIEWLKTHDSEAEQISINATNFIKSSLMPEQIDGHFAIILNEYATIQKDPQIQITLLPEEEILEKIKIIENAPAPQKKEKKKNFFSKFIRSIKKRFE